jgi:hypothetical protein
MIPAIAELFGVLGVFLIVERLVRNAPVEPRSRKNRSSRAVYRVPEPRANENEVSQNVEEIRLAQKGTENFVAHRQV